MNLFIPVNIEALPEYLSSGFIGLTSSREPANDFMSEIFPKALGYRSQKNNHDVLLKISCDDRDSNLDNHKSDTVSIDGPISIARIEKILFKDERLKSNFEASFEMFPDIPIDLFALELISNDENKDILEISSPIENAIKIKKPSGKFKNEIAHVIPLLVGIAESATWLNKSFDLEIDILLRSKTIKNQYLELIKTYLNKLGILKETSEFSFDLLECYFTTVDKFLIEKSGNIESPALINMMLNQLPNPKKSEESNNYVRRILEKARNILMGFEGKPNLFDDEHLSLQRSVFLAITAKDTHSFNAHRHSANVGSLVESLAKLILMYKSRTGYLSSSLWRENREMMNSYLFAAEEIIEKKSFNLQVGKAIPEVRRDFSLDQFIRINEITIRLDRIDPPTHLGEVIAKLASLGYENILPISNTKVGIECYEGNYKYNVELEITATNTSDHSYVKIGVLTQDGIKLLGNRKHREQIFSLMSRYMVYPEYKSGDKNLVLARSQLVDTMDKDELRDHISLVTQAIHEIKSRLEDLTEVNS